MKYNLLIVFLLLPLSNTSFPHKYTAKIVKFINFSTNPTELIGNNHLPPIKRTSTCLVFLCRDPIPAAIHFVSSEVKECRNAPGTLIGTCPNTRMITLDLEQYHAGEYYITSFSTSTDDGTDESSGGFCAEGLKLSITLIDGEDSTAATIYHDRPFTLEETEEMKKIKADLQLDKVNEIARHYASEHNKSDPALFNEPDPSRIYINTDDQSRYFSLLFFLSTLTVSVVVLVLLYKTREKISKYFIGTSSSSDIQQSIDWLQQTDHARDSIDVIELIENNHDVGK